MERRRLTCARCPDGALSAHCPLLPVPAPHPVHRQPDQPRHPRPTGRPRGPHHGQAGGREAGEPAGVRLHPRSGPPGNRGGGRRWPRRPVRSTRRVCSWRGRTTPSWICWRRPSGTLRWACAFTGCRQTCFALCRTFTGTGRAAPAARSPSLAFARAACHPGTYLHQLETTTRSNNPDRLLLRILTMAIMPAAAAGHGGGACRQLEGPSTCVGSSRWLAFLLDSLVDDGDAATATPRLTVAHGRGPRGPWRVRQSTPLKEWNSGTSSCTSTT